MPEGSTESIESWIERKARNISGPRTHLQDTKALIQFGLAVAHHVLAAQKNAAREARWKQPRVKVFTETVGVEPDEPIETNPHDWDDYPRNG